VRIEYNFYINQLGRLLKLNSFGSFLIEGMVSIKLVSMGVEADATLTHQSKFTALQKCPCPTDGTIATLSDLTFANGLHLNSTHISLHDVVYI
jgi:hypothetical protein